MATSDEIATTRTWNVSFDYKPGRDGIEGATTVAMMNALQERGWRPSLSEPNDEGWRVVTCHGVEAERADLAEGLVFHTCIDAIPSPPSAIDFNVTPEIDGLPVGGTWTGSGDADDFTVTNG